MCSRGRARSLPAEYRIRTALPRSGRTLIQCGQPATTHSYPERQVHHARLRDPEQPRTDSAMPRAPGWRCSSGSSRSPSTLTTGCCSPGCTSGARSSAGALMCSMCGCYLTSCACSPADRASAGADHAKAKGGRDAAALDAHTPPRHHHSYDLPCQGLAFRLTLPTRSPSARQQSREGRLRAGSVTRYPLASGEQSLLFEGRWRCPSRPRTGGLLESALLIRVATPNCLSTRSLR